MAVACVAGVVASAPTAQAATDYAPGTVDNADPTPVMGWSSWSFTRFAGDLALDEAEANAMISDGLTSVGYDYLNIDDGWYECPSTAGPLTDPYGRWIPWSSPEVIGGTTYPPPFPGSGSLNGIQVLANYVHSLGLKFGIYETMGISANAVAAATPILEPGQTGLPGSQTTVTGETAASIGETGQKQANYNCGNQDVINYTGSGLTGAAATAEEAAAQDYTDSVVDELASWGVDYIKLDGTTYSTRSGHVLINAPDVQAWQQAIAQSGRPIVLNLTQGSFTSPLAPTLAEYGNQWEQPGDIEINGPSEGNAGSCNVGSGFPLYAQTFAGCTDVFPLTSYSHWDNRFAFFGGSSTTSSFEWFGGPGGFNDGDSIEVGDGAGTGVSTTSNSGMSQSAEETQLGLWTMGSAPLILGGDLSSSISNGYGTIASQNSSGLAPFDQSLLLDKEVIAVDQSAEDAVQVSTSGSLASRSAAGNQVFTKVLPTGQAYVALFNTSASTSTPTASISTTVSAINTAIGTFNTNVASKNPVQTYPLPVIPTLAVDSNGYELQDLWGTDSLDTGGSLATGQYAGTISSGTISATVPSEGVALFLVTPLSGATLTAPSITSPASSTFYYATAGNVTIQTSGYPTAALTESGTLPSGVFFEDNGTASLFGTPASGSEGTYHFTITAANGTNPAASQSYVLTVDPATPTVTVSGSPDPATNGTASVSYSVLVSGAGATPTGSVSVSDGKGGICTIASLGAGAGSCSVTEAVGTYTVTATYSGDGNYTSATATIGETVVNCGGKDQGCNLSGADLANAHLAGDNFAGSNLKDADLNGANLSGANLQGANLQGASGSGANLANADLQGDNLRGDTFSGANFAGSNLQGDNLQNGNFSGADFQGDNLSGANLQNADLSGANLKGANLQGANLKNVTWSNTTCPDGTNSNADGGTCVNNL
jgi:uncharacterized protein YjbI with pentapeptide repeats